MDIQQLQQQIEDLKSRIDDLERSAIQINVDPMTVLYLKNAVGAQIYSTSTPSGSAPTGSIWFRNTGVIANNEIHMYSGSAWAQIK